ncbi:MAG: glycosylase, partial [Chitinophagaceae bacterium]
MSLNIYGMFKTILCILVLIIAFQCSCSSKQKMGTNEFSEELVHFLPYKGNPLFSGTGTNTWDKEIRERGYILKEDSGYYLWYTGYTLIDSIKYLGYATSPDGLTWIKYPGNPIYKANWVEDMCVIKDNSTYYMFAEGRGDTAHLLTSTDRIHWQEQGNLDIRLMNGEPIPPGSYGTPTIWKENNTWYLFYERGDLGIWLATSPDCKKWTNIQDEPVIKMGPDAYDQFAVAMNHVIKYKGLYYGYYHASAFKDWREWSTNVAVSADLIHWKKYPKNPLVRNNKSSGILVNDGKRFRLYTMHPDR